MKKNIILLLTLTLLFWVAEGAKATPITFIGPGASATFDVSGSNLVVTLTNTSNGDILVPTDVLTGVYFTVSGALAPASAIINTGSTVENYSPFPLGGNVGGEWAYAAGLSGAPGGATNGIAAVGLGLFGQANFQGPNLTPPPGGGLDGIDWGLASAGDIPATGNAHVVGSALIKNSVVFNLSGLPEGFDPSTTISNVSFQYGSGLAGAPVPEPATMLLLGSGLIGLAGYGRKKFFKK